MMQTALGDFWFDIRRPPGVRPSVEVSTRWRLDFYQAVRQCTEAQPTYGAWELVMMTGCGDNISERGGQTRS